MKFTVKGITNSQSSVLTDATYRAFKRSLMNSQPGVLLLKWDGKI